MSNRTIYEVKLLDLLPENLRTNPDIVAASKAVDSGFLVIAEQAKDLVILPRVNQQPEPILDHLAYYLHVDFYDQSLSIETKRKLVQESVYIHQIKGTPRAVEVLIETLFDEGEVVEWFDYGGAPYMFRVETPNESVTQERASDFIRALDSVKNIRSHLESVIILQIEKMNLFYGGFVHIGSYETYKQVGD
ncbi:phage tail protein I [Bacillus solitudinis]|uniref:phage tail protein I n=1 Tax=Bacillus solitudinis TaxID=2014074 RepID=UPI000C242A03|nr:phage tail protein I [Bacillus solitudinis]